MKRWITHSIFIQLNHMETNNITVLDLFRLKMELWMMRREMKKEGYQLWKDYRKELLRDLKRDAIIKRRNAISLL